MTFNIFWYNIRRPVNQNLVPNWGKVREGWEWIRNEISGSSKEWDYQNSLPCILKNVYAFSDMGKHVKDEK